MLLAVDIGNTNTVIGLMDGTKLRFRWRISSDTRRTHDEFAILIRQLCAQSGTAIEDITGVAVCSVVPALTTAFVSMAQKEIGVDPFVAAAGSDLGIVIDYRDPGDVGPDRLMNAVAVGSVADGPAIVVDFGTATTFDVVDADGRYLGGAIAPGIATSVESLFRRTALLHRVALEPPKTAIGKSTDESLKSGIIYGAVGQVDEIVRRITTEWGEAPTVVATGGLAEKIALFSKRIDVVEPDLTLLGLALAYERVRGKGQGRG
jgi:type III pantothenate kinase